MWSFFLIPAPLPSLALALTLGFSHSGTLLSPLSLLSLVTFSLLLPPTLLSLSPHSSFSLLLSTGQNELRAVMEERVQRARREATRFMEDAVQVT